MFRIDMRLEGLEDLQEQLSELILNADESVVRVSNFVAQSTAQRAKNLIRQSVPAGRTYYRDDPRRLVTASAPGQPPAIDTGELVTNISFKKATDTSGAYAFSRAEYSEDLEFGTYEFAARPFMSPALAEAILAGEKRFVSIAKEQML